MIEQLGVDQSRRRRAIKPRKRNPLAVCSAKQAVRQVASNRDCRFSHDQLRLQDDMLRDRVTRADFFE
jgi:hypothetical protein